jgi:ABC-type nitrate/sulfonate/bicarbonate transport system substrate-binding protein
VLVGQPKVRSPEELKGKRIGVSSVGGMSAYLVREIIARNDLNPDRDVTLLAIGGTSARTAALFGGTIDAALVVAPDNYALERKGYRRLLIASDYVNYPLSGVASVRGFSNEEQSGRHFFSKRIDGRSQVHSRKQERQPELYQKLSQSSRR